VISRRREVAEMYEDRLGQLNELQLPPAPQSDSDNFDIYQNYELQADKRDKLKTHLSENGVGTLIQWGGIAIHQYTSLGFNQHCPNTDKFFDRCIMLPMNTFISNDDINHVCDTIIEFYRG